MGWSEGLEQTIPAEKDPYLKRMLSDLRQAENELLANISNKANPFRNDGVQRVADSQANVDRLHELIRSYLAPKLDGITAKQQGERK